MKISVSLLLAFVPFAMAIPSPVISTPAPSEDSLLGFTESLYAATTGLTLEAFLQTPAIHRAGEIDKVLQMETLGYAQCLARGNEQKICQLLSRDIATLVDAHQNELDLSLRPVTGGRVAGLLKQLKGVSRNEVLQVISHLNALVTETNMKKRTTSALQARATPAASDTSSCKKTGTT
ncbi:hypothetical protein P7C73_g2847, partial [Tremellales sp. Uapishka_1]